jgi:hypothetical protein
MKIFRVALLVIALALPVFAGEIPNGVTASGEMQNGVTAAGDIPFNVTLLNLLLLLL